MHTDATRTPPVRRVMGALVYRWSHLYGNVVWNPSTYLGREQDGNRMDAAAKAKALKATLEDERIEAVQRMLWSAEGRAKLAAYPHPVAWKAAAYETLLDYARWMFDNSARTGKLKATKLIEKTINREV